MASRPLVGMEEEASQLEKACRAARAAVDMEMADAGSSSDESAYGSMEGKFCGGHREASLTHLLNKGDEKTGMVMGRRVCTPTYLSAHGNMGNPPVLTVICCK